MFKQVVAIGLLTAYTGDVIIAKCKCCGIAYDTANYDRTANSLGGYCPKCFIEHGPRNFRIDCPREDTLADSLYMRDENYVARVFSNGERGYLTEAIS